MQTIIPPRLKKGDKVGIISPSQSIQNRMEKFEKAKTSFSQRTGLELILGSHTLGRYYYSSGTVQERLSDFHQFLKDPSIKGILFSVGGNTAIDLIDKLDYELIRKNPKIISGISDATTILNPIFVKTGLITFLGLEFTMFGWLPMDYTYEQIEKTWFEGTLKEVTLNPKWKNYDDLPTTYNGWQTIRPGTAKGRIIGGNLGSITYLSGTDYYPSLDQNIFVFEGYRMHKKAIHHRLISMRLRGEFKRLSGIIVGYCLGSDDPTQPGDERSLKDMLLEVTEGYDFPIMQVGEIGHRVENILLPIGAIATMDAINLKFTIDEPVVR